MFIGAARELDTSSDAPDEACRNTLKDTSEEAKLHCGSACRCVFLDVRSYTFIRRSPIRAWRHFVPPARAGILAVNLRARANLSTDDAIIPYSLARAQVRRRRTRGARAKGQEENFTL